MSLGGGTSTEQTTGTSSNEIPQWVKDKGRALFAQAEQVAGRDFPVYQGDRIASFSPEQLESFNLTEDAVGSWQPAFANSFMAAGAGSAPVNANDISNYMNPYTDQVVNRAIVDMDRQYNRDRIDRNASMSKRGSYLNEDRRAVIDNLAFEAHNRNIGSVSANSWEDAFKQALGQANTERSRTLESSRIFQDLGPMAQSLGFADAGAMSAIGEQTQGQAQDALTLQYQDFLREFGYPQEQINQLISALGGVPYESKTTTTQEQLVGQNDNTGQLLGTMAMLGAMMMSDVRLKKDLTPIGRRPDGIVIYAYRYVWDKGPGHRIGVLAQDVERVNPKAVITTGSGYKAVDYSMVRAA